MQKTAGSSIRAMLGAVCPELELPCEFVEPVEVANAKWRNHERARKRQRFVTGSTRNPYDWYVSLFARRGVLI